MVDQKSPVRQAQGKNQKQETDSFNSSSKPALTMADLMKSVKTSFKTFHKGDIVTGKIKKLTSNEILVDIDAKTDAVVLEKDKKNLRTILASLKVGDAVSVSILNPESDMGNPVVSLRRFIDDLMWNRLSLAQKDQEALDAYVNEKTSGGYLVSASGGILGFLPNSHLSVSHDDSQTVNNQDLVGRQVKVYVLDLNRQSHKIIFSQKQVMDSKAFEEVAKNLKVGQKTEAVISNVTPFGVFVSVKAGSKYIDGLIHISEIAWEKVSSTEDMFNVGQKIEAVIINIDNTAKRIDLSIKRQTIDPFEELAKKFVIDQKVSGIVSEVISAGIILNLGENVEGLIRREKIPPAVSYKTGDKVNAIVTQIDTRKRRVILVPVLLEKFVGYK